MEAKVIIANRIAKEMKDGDVVNLGIGLPTMIPSYLDKNVHITLHSENGFVGLSELKEKIPDLVNAGGQPCGIAPGGMFFDSAFSFAIVRGGHLDISVLGGLQVDQEGNLANWMVPGKMVPGMGGAMDLVAGSKMLIIAMEHNTKDGGNKILKKCTLPLTAVGKVKMLVSEKAVFRFIDGKMVLVEIAPGLTVDDIKACTEAEFLVSPECKEMILPQG